MPRVVHVFDSFSVRQPGLKKLSRYFFCFIQWFLSSQAESTTGHGPQAGYRLLGVVSA